MVGMKLKIKNYIVPELPEVQTTVNGLNSKVLNRTFVDVWSDWKKLIKMPKDFDLFKKELKGKKIKRVWRRAKNVVFELSGGCSLLIHQKMTGHLLHGTWNIKHGTWVPAHSGPLEDKINSYIHLIFFLNNGKMIALSDVRKFAKAELWKTEDLMEDFKKLGPEPLEKDFTFNKFKERFINKKGKIKTILMEPKIIVGVGNIYASEALWWAKINPEKDASKLNDKELKALYISVKKVLLEGIKFGGDSFSDYRNVDGEAGKFENNKKVYKREGEKCFRCKNQIKRVKFGGRSTFFCPQCQG